ncbi:hypothetical protein D9M68_665970 [compost metagenome]
MRHPQRALRRGSGGEPGLGQVAAIHGTRFREEARHLVHGDAARLWRAMEAAFDQQGPGAVVAGFAEAAEIAHAHAGGVPGIGNDGGGIAQRQRQVDIALFHACQLQRHVGIAHRMEVQQPVGLLDPGADLGRAAAFLADGGAQLVVAPDAVHVFVDEARGRVVGGVEAVERGQIAKGQRQRAAARPQARRQGVLQRPGAAEFIAMDQRAEHDMLARHARIEMPDSRRVRIARSLRGQVRTGKKKRAR